MVQMVADTELRSDDVDAVCKAIVETMGAAGIAVTHAMIRASMRDNGNPVRDGLYRFVDKADMSGTCRPAPVQAR